MLILLSPAKRVSPLATQDAAAQDAAPQSPAPQSAVPKQEHPLAFAEQTAALVSILSEFSTPQLRRLMGISEPLAELNRARYRDFHTHTAHTPAGLLFAGDVYRGLDAASLSPADWRYAVKHLRILSGLYGVLSPEQRIQPYRLEMGVRLATEKGSDLYAFWGARIAQKLREHMQEQKIAQIVNLASREYAHAARPFFEDSEWVDVAFQEWRKGRLMTIGLLAKNARGMMARYMIKERVSTVEQIKKFQQQGYAYSPEHSTQARSASGRKLVFTRQAAQR